MPDVATLVSIVRARHPGVHIVTSEEPEACDLVADAASELNAHLWQWDALDGLTSPLEHSTPPVKDTANLAAACTWLVLHDLSSVVLLRDVGQHLEDPVALRALRRLLFHAQQTGTCVVVVGLGADLPESVKSWLTPFQPGYPDEEEIDAIIRATLKELHVQRRIEIDIRGRDYEVVLKNLQGLSRRHCAQLIRSVVSTDRRFDREDLNRLLAEKRALLKHRGVLEFVESPTSLDAIGGMRRLKAWLAERAGAFSRRAAEFGISPPRGVLLLGVQGAGKSLCAKAIATAWQRPLLRLDPGTLYDRYVGESERRLRDAFRQAEAMAPIVLWIDEIEKGFASAGEASNDGGLSRRMFGSLLTWMQEHTSPVFLVATANDVQALPPELLRKGRFDEIFFVDLPNAEAREAILRSHLARRGLEPASFDIPALVDAGESYSGAEIEQAIVSGLHAAFNRDEPLATAHVAAALRDSPPLSVVMAERIGELRRWASTRCVPAD